jgi:hypothetical protein
VASTWPGVLCGSGYFPFQAAARLDSFHRTQFSQFVLEFA